MRRLREQDAASMGTLEAAQARLRQRDQEVRDGGMRNHHDPRNGLIIDALWRQCGVGTATPHLRSAVHTAVCASLIGFSNYISKLDSRWRHMACQLIDMHIDRGCVAFFLCRCWTMCAASCLGTVVVST